MSDIQQTLDRLYRRHYGEILAFLLNRIGYHNFELAEEAVQTAFERALQQWAPDSQTKTTDDASPNSIKLPDNPAGWLSIVARNVAVDMLRKQQRPAPVPDHADHAPIAEDEPDLDDVAKMVLLCCNPEINTASQVCLALKAACGFRVREISRILGLQYEAAKKMLTRARSQIVERPASLEELNQQNIHDRFSTVLETIYAIFTEGYSASAGENQSRPELAEEALRLADLMLASPSVPENRKPELQALLALILFQLGRFPARVDSEGVPVRLADQDRARWDRRYIVAGMNALSASQKSERLTTYHLEARIAAEHMRGESFTTTDWRRILDLYEQLLAMKDTIQVRLNRLVALRYAEGPAAALRELETISSGGEAPRSQTEMSRSSAFAWSFLYHAVQADLLEAAGRPAEARESWQAARDGAPTVQDRRFVERRLHSGAPGDLK